MFLGYSMGEHCSLHRLSRKILAEDEYFCYPLRDMFTNSGLAWINETSKVLSDLSAVFPPLRATCFCEAFQGFFADAFLMMVLTVMIPN